MKRIIKFISTCLQILCPFTLFCRIQYIKKIIRSLWLQPLFKECHHTVVFGEIGCLIGAKSIMIGQHSCFGDFLYLECRSFYRFSETQNNNEPEIRIGKNAWFGAYNHITCTNAISIGNGVLTGKYVTISDNNHGNSDLTDMDIRPINRSLTSKGSISIGDNVWIGEKATILGGVTIGKGAIIASNSVVTKNVPEHSVVAGVPARIIKQYK